MIKDINNSPKISIPHIENPEVRTWEEKDMISIQKAPELSKQYNYEYGRYHWVGNGDKPIYFFCVEFSAMVSGATYIEVRRTDDAVVIYKNISCTETMEKVTIGGFKTPVAAYTLFNALKFVARNDAQIEASIDWTKNEQGIKTLSPRVKMEKSNEEPSDDQWQYPLIRLTWSLTNRCNLHCKHCAFREMQSDMDVLNESEIRSVVKDIIQLGVVEVCLSGGEALLSPYWYEIAKTLSQAGVKVSLITNGTCIDYDCAARIKEAGIQHVSVSIDDLGEQSDTIRGMGSYQQAVKGIEQLKAVKMPVSIITTVNALNIRRLDKMRSVFTALGADTWGLKPIYPIGEAARNPKLWLDEQDVNKVIDFCYAAISTPGLPVVPALAFEMHTEKGAAVLRSLYGDAIHTEFNGSHAGIFSAQLHPDGNLVGDCMCQLAYAAGNVKERSLAEIWRDKHSFQELREFDASALTGYCGVCDRRDTCKGGDLNARLAFGGIYAENKLCAYRNFNVYGTTV